MEDIGVWRRYGWWKIYFRILRIYIMLSRFLKLLCTFALKCCNATSTQAGKCIESYLCPSVINGWWRFEDDVVL